MAKPDCRTCGVCCVAYGEQDVYCDVDEKDLKRLSPGFVRKHIVNRYTADKIVILDTGADLIFGTLLAKCNIPSIAIGAALNSYFNILDRAHANKLLDAYAVESDQNWMIV